MVAVGDFLEKVPLPIQTELSKVIFVHAYWDIDLESSIRSRIFRIRFVTGGPL
jgi:hypothetical protein